MISKDIFRAYDIRGTYNKNFFIEDAYLVGKAFASYLIEHDEKEVLIASDRRLSSPVLKEALLAGLVESGLHIIDIGFLPTPLLYFATHELGVENGVMVTASHNPASDNGFKLIQGKQALSPEAIQQLYQIIQKESFIKGKGWFGWDREVVALYTKKLKTIFPSLEKKKIVLDCGNAVAGEIAPKIFSELGCNVIPLFCNADGNFPNRDPDPSNPDHLAALSQKIKEVNADVGFALDGDADRLFIVDEDGKPVTADHLIMLFAKSVIEKQKKAEVVVGSKCSNLIKQYVANLSGECHFAKTGHTAIKEKMQETDALFGTEASGHFIFKDTWYGFDDGLFAAARLLELLSRNRKTVSQLVTELPQSVITPEIRVVVSDKEKEKIISRLISEAEAIDAEKNYLDGLRLEYPFGWGIVRASNTAACLTLRFEADTQDNLEVIQQQFRELLKTEKLFF